MIYSLYLVPVTPAGSANDKDLLSPAVLHTRTRTPANKHIQLCILHRWHDRQQARSGLTWERVNAWEYYNDSANHYWFAFLAQENQTLLRHRYTLIKVWELVPPPHVRPELHAVSCILCTQPIVAEGSSFSKPGRRFVPQRRIHDLPTFNRASWQNRTKSALTRFTVIEMCEFNFKLSLINTEIYFFD